MTKRPIAPQAGMDDRGWEVPDPEPVALPVYVRKGASTLDQLREQAFAAQRAAQDQSYVESFEEADDFDTGDDDYEKVPFMDAVDNRNDHQEYLRNQVRETVRSRRQAAHHPAKPDKDDSRGNRESGDAPAGSSPAPNPPKAPSRKRENPEGDPS